MTPTDFKIETGLSVKACQELLGVSDTRWYEWDTGNAPIPKYIQSSMQAHIEAIRLKRVILKAAQGDMPWHRLTGAVEVYWPEVAKQMRGGCA